MPNLNRSYSVTPIMEALQKSMQNTPPKASVSEPASP